SLGPAGAIGVVCAFLAMVTLLPAVLGLLGRWVFWPRIPRHGAPRPAMTVWDRVGAAVGKRPRVIWLGTLVVLGLFALGLLG
ncbi:MMPL family transporter, partial [Escherichia coli]|nr:MMPL family transporter [Escherichia coli]